MNQIESLNRMFIDLLSSYIFDTKFITYTPEGELNHFQSKPRYFCVISKLNIQEKINLLFCAHR